MMINYEAGNSLWMYMEEIHGDSKNDRTYDCLMTMVMIIEQSITEED